MLERHACKIFDENKKIDSKDLEQILEMGRLSPSSFGMEPTRFLVIQSQEIKEMLKPVCWNQRQITTCSDLVVLLTEDEKVKNDKEYMKNMFTRRGLSDEHTEKYLNLYDNFMSDKDGKTLYDWSAKQAYIASANMMTYASINHIDSCPIEGFEEQKVRDILNIDKTQNIALLIAFGYRVKPASKKYRLDLKELVEFR